MGQTLSEPITDKHTTFDADNRLAYAASSMQGWRITMEDAHTTILDLEPAAASTPNSRFSFFAVYDGHGGSAVAKYAGNHLHRKIVQDSAFAKKEYKTAIKNGFLQTDVDLKISPEYLADPAGCTAVTILITDDMTVYCGNAGDSRSVLCSKGEAIALSYDHKPTNAGESSRIRAAGGYVEFGRVNGNLALSRAVGDFEFKQNVNLGPEDQIVTVNPDIEVRQLVVREDDFIVLACDGIWDCMTNEQVVDFVMSKIAEDFRLETICEQIMEYCLAGDSDVGGVGCDNMTVVIVAILGDGNVSLSYDDWIAQVKRRWAAKENKTVFATKESRRPSSGRDHGDDS
ncbi:Protein phosphatase 2C 2 [Entophlyctis luteolus]|nr:Protein phosphatase 2C 2 [Entophlyctis luteolus]